MHGATAGLLFSTQPERFRILAITPFERPDLALARSLSRQQVAVAVDIGRDAQTWPTLLSRIAAEPAAGLGLRIPDGVKLGELALPASVQYLIVAGTADNLPLSWRRLPFIAQVRSVAEGELALAAGAAGLIAKGQESGGQVGEESSFVLLQRLVAQTAARVPVWSQGGIGLHTAAGAFAGGAFGIVLDAVLAAFPESTLPAELKNQILAMDGSEVRNVAGYNVYARSQGEIAALEGLDIADLNLRLTPGNSNPSPLLAIGQDAALARLVMADCSNIEALIQTLRLRVDGQLHQARKLRPLAEHGAWARAHGLRYPVAQGPMTRVSDTAAFSAAVADAGGLPFLALSLMQAGASRKLLEATREQVGDRPWGVGVLGFAAPEILDPQLELIKEFKPSVLLLAGGRPSQARPFIEMGIPTYLHVPSPGLLDIFLKDGATHFVFEGRECGGHVGPRYSFVLWEQALARLAQVEHPEELHILFAGGIHDERSSAMVAALAAPLAARGAKIGVLMGTAYIGTREAVTCGTVLEGFQQRALSGDATVLVETAPGHAIRCLPSGFVDLFAREKQRLQREGVDQKEAWKQLETLTVGRLRIATKGVDYVDGQLAAVDADRQRAEGMYMIGQVIAMKREVTTIAALHEQVTRGADDYLARLDLPPLRLPAKAEPIAVIGMACLYAGSADLESYWANIVEGRDLVGEVPAERWSAARYYQAGGMAADKSVSKWGGFIADTPFDPLKYGIPPASLAAIEPVQLLSLEVASQALKDAGYQGKWFDRERTSVIFGAESGMDLANQYNFRNMYPQYCGELPPALAAALPSLTEDSFPGILVNVISGRIANRLGLGGVNYSVDSACASSLTAVELAVKELRAGSSEMVLAGGADFHNGISDFLMFSSVGALSPSGRCRSFDNNADGIALGEGVGIVVLKRLSDAERDGDRIYALIDGVAGSSDGKALGLTAPRKEGQKRALDRTYWQAGVLPAEIGLIEAHGTGTVVGDRTELKTLTEVFNTYGGVPGQAGLGSVKSQIGHTKCAAGVAGLIKAAKALHHRVLPPTGAITAPNAWYRSDTSPFQLNRAPTPWLANGSKARAAVSAFGFGGTNFHAVMSAYPAHHNALGALQWPAELFAVRGSNAAEAETTLRKLASFASKSDAPVALRDLAAAAWNAGSGPVQFAFVATDRASLSQRIAAALEHRSGAGISYRAADAASGKLAYLFSGQGSQYTGMLRELFVYFPALQSLLASGSEYLPVMYPPTAYDETTRTRQQQRLTDTRNTQPALGLVELAAFEWLRGVGLQPDMAAGHSYGELAALATAGAFDATTLIALSRARAEAILASVGEDSGAMAAVRLDVEALGPLLAGFPSVVMANQNSPVQTVISGPTQDVHAACALLKQHAVGYKLIDTDCAFHSPLMAAAEQRYAQVLADQSIGALRWPVYSNISAAPHVEDADTLRSSLARHIVSPVRFVAEIERMYADGARVFVEIGPRKVLTSLAARILKDLPHTALAIDPEERGLAGLLETLAQLAVLMPNLDIAALFANRSETLDLAAPRMLSATTWWVNGGRAWPLRGKAPTHGAAVVLEPVVDLTVAAKPIAALPAASLSAGEQAIVGYLSNMREMVNAQRDVLLGYFGAPAATYAATYSEDRRRPAVLPSPSGRDRRSFIAAGMSPGTGQLLPPLAGEGWDGGATTAPRLPPPPQPSPASGGGSGSLEAPTPAGPDARSALLQIVSERTGYPADMLDLDLDLEADLSIDSIKRLEIIGELSQQLAIRNAIGAGADVLLEQLAAQKTLRAMLSWLADKLPSQPVPVLAAVAAPTAAPALNVAEVLLDIVSQSTGYPPEALDLDLDLEADLSIDSIKRLEVVGQLASRLGIDGGSDKDAMLERLSGLKTLREMISWLVCRPTDSHHHSTRLLSPGGVTPSRHSDGYGSSSRLAGHQNPLSTDGANLWDGTLQREHAAAAPATASAAVVEDRIPLERYVLRRQQIRAAMPGDIDLAGKQFLITDDKLGLAPLVAAALQARGALPRIVEFSGSTVVAGLDQVDGLIHLWSLNPDSLVIDVKHFFAMVREALLKRARHLLVASSLGGDFGVAGGTGTGSQAGRGGGFAGMVKSVIKEFPELRAHWVDLDLNESQELLARCIEQELVATNPVPEVAYQAGLRYAREVVPVELQHSSLAGLALTADSVVLLTGGARGITALIATALARRYRCHIEMLGRSALPEGDESAVTRGIDDPRRLRQLLLQAEPTRKPAEIERLARRILAEREVRDTFAQLRAAGSSFNYTQLDVRDSEGFAQFIKDAYARRGRIDGVIHGAGVVEDKLVRDKTDESFGRVFDTKVHGALILDKLIRDDVKFVVFFSSVASAFGNRGQVDYASANDVLDKLAHSWQTRIAGRVLSVNWGPWADTGMVSESLKNEYQRKGIGLIPQNEGVDALLRELSTGAGDSQVVLMCGKPDSFGASSGSRLAEA
ncbi:type I polyketide synthase [Hydrocarboniphaga sp.]|uniref:type I polyketide synthase n=1 Tax=Hydrocarboniphaga sp. TaxID=2033016 RepID=UPI002603F9A2|nr:type I polyketide synthase [Hydrocarboniphaga sp.]